MPQNSSWCNASLTRAYDTRLQLNANSSIEQVVEEHIWNMCARLFKRCPYEKIIAHDGNAQILQEFRAFLIKEYGGFLDRRRAAAYNYLNDESSGPAERRLAEEEILLPDLSGEERARIVIPKGRENESATSPDVPVPQSAEFQSV
ncbi:MAG: hypothetical protein WC477_04415 [Patescibacteria group bacterium]